MIETGEYCPQCDHYVMDHSSIHDNGDTITFNCDDCGCEFSGKVYLIAEISDIKIIERGNLHDEEE